MKLSEQEKAANKAAQTSRKTINDILADIDLAIAESEE